MQTRPELTGVEGQIKLLKAPVAVLYRSRAFLPDKDAYAFFGRGRTAALKALHG